MAITKAKERVTQLYIECSAHPVRVKLVTKAYLYKVAGGPANGYFSSENNTIYLNKSFAELELVHILLHELKHAYDYQTQELTEEGKADAFGALLIKLFTLKNIKDLLVCR